MRREVEGPLEQPTSPQGNFHVYIVTNKIHTVLYIGVTGHLAGRIYQHRERLTDGFTKRYQAATLIYFERFTDQETAEKREKQLKGWRRSKKLALIEKMNPHWLDLFRPTTNRPEFQPAPGKSNCCERLFERSFDSATLRSGLMA